jgi:hypothetical protein
MKPTSVVYLSLLLFISHFNYAQTTINDPEIKNGREVKAENLGATVRKLVFWNPTYTKRHQSDTRIGQQQRWVNLNLTNMHWSLVEDFLLLIDYFTIKADGRRIARQ